MTVHNAEIADIFSKLANLLEIEGANPFRVRAYRNAARVIGNLSKNVADMVAQGEKLSELPGIGKDLAEKITTIVTTGELPLLKEIEKKTPAILNELMKIEGLGPKRVQLIYKTLKIKNIPALKSAIEKGRLRQLPGFGEKIEKNILNGIQHANQYQQRVKWADACPIVTSLLRYMQQQKGIEKIECAGSYRRCKETVGDLDVVIAAKAAEKIIDHFVHFEEVANILSKGPTRSTVHLHSGIQVDLRVITKEEYGAALFYFTGSKEHNIAIRNMAIKKKLKINEYGVFKGKKRLAGRTETDLYHHMGLPYIEPELREDRGEIQAALQHRLPTLIQLKDIRGDLHCHTHATDGDDSLEAMAQAAEKRGYDYLAITDHSQRLTVAHGLDKKALFAQIKKIEKINARLKKLVILKSIELDILEDGSLDLPNDVLKELDLTVCSVHSSFHLSLKKQTERIIRAMDNPYFTILAHPTGRLINRREPYALDMEKLFQAAKARGCILELNAQPERLDLNDVHCQRAKELGVKIAISSDAHSVSQLSNLPYGINQARRGWLEKSDVVNTRRLTELKKLLKRK